jgi:hypothetical protein
MNLTRRDLVLAPRELHGDPSPDRDTLSTPASRSIFELSSPSDSRRVESGVTACLHYLYAIHGPPLGDTHPQNGLTLHLGIPEVQRVFDGHFPIEGRRSLDLPSFATTEEEGRE